MGSEAERLSVADVRRKLGTDGWFLVRFPNAHDVIRRIEAEALMEESRNRTPSLRIMNAYTAEQADLTLTWDGNQRVYTVTPCTQIEGQE